jgi:uncharacterized protein YifE (UPF0438 family)
MPNTSSTVLSKEVLLRKVFSDAKNYPYGFSRSGDFSISESRALAEYGCYISALIDGQIEATSEDDVNMISAIRGDIPPQNTAQTAWIKYQKRINRPKTDSIYGTKRIASSHEDELVVSTEDDDDMDFDD